MVKFKIDQVRKMMQNTGNIRNLSVIAHVDHGKTTLVDSLVEKAGMISEKQVGTNRLLDTLPDEKEMGITIKSTSVSLYFEQTDEKEQTKVPFLINLIDSPGHVDFSSEVTAALRVSDGALVVVDCVESVCCQTKTVLRQALAERVKPILFMNKLDRIFCELNMDLEDAYQKLRKSIESVNAVIAMYQEEKMDSFEVRPEDGTVGFGSGYYAWGFNLYDFAKMYCSKSNFKKTPQQLMKKLWGDYFWNPKKKKIVKGNPDGTFERTFVKFVLAPIQRVIQTTMNKSLKSRKRLIGDLNLMHDTEIREEIEQNGKPLMKAVMRKWLPASEVLLRMITMHLPSPLHAQPQRIEKLYTGPLDTEDAMAIRKCLPSGPTAIYITKLVQFKKHPLYAFGRIFSGTVQVGDTVRVYGPDYKHGRKKDLHHVKVKGVVVLMANKVESVDIAPAGNMIALVGVDKYLLKSGTITSSENVHPFHTMRFRVSPVVQVAVRPEKSQHLPKFKEALLRLVKTNTLVKVIQSDEETLIGCAGELHLKICLNQLNESLKGIPIRVSPPIISYAETITCASGEDQIHPEVVVAKSPNKLNRIFVTAEPLSQELIQDIEEDNLASMMQSEPKQLVKILTEKHGWNRQDAKRIWSFGCPPDSLPNVLVDQTSGVQYLKDVRQMIINAFMKVTSNGVLSGERLRGVRFNIVDGKFHADPPHRGVAQIEPAARRAFYAAQMASVPRFQGPMFSVDISTPQSQLASVQSTLSKRKGYPVSITSSDVGPDVSVRAILPVVHSFGFVGSLRGNTGGAAFAQMSFSHFETISADPFVAESEAYELLKSIRKRKGKNESIPKFNDYYDKI